jgi:hypothetical protein
MAHLESLQLRATHITDAGLKHLSNLTNLKDLDLYGTSGISDAGIDHIAVLAALEKLDVTGTQVTPIGRARLEQALPVCRIVH